MARRSPRSNSQIIYLLRYPYNRIFNRLWKRAAKALKVAEEVVVIGHSIPSADSAAWTLLQTCCDGARTKVVNPSKSVLMNRYGWLLHLPNFAEAMDFGAWLDRKVSEAGYNGMPLLIAASVRCYSATGLNRISPKETLLLRYFITERVPHPTDRRAKALVPLRPASTRPAADWKHDCGVTGLVAPVHLARPDSSGTPGTSPAD